MFDGASFVLNADRSLAVPAAGVPRKRRHHALGAAHGDGWRCDDGPMRARSRSATRPTTRPACWACATTSTRTASPASCSGCPAASTPRSCAAMAVDALGAERVRCVMLPYRYTSQESLDDAAACAKALGVRYDIVPIAPAVEGFEAALEPALRRAAARRHRGESAGARARHHPDGDLQQVRSDGGDHRQQVGDVGRLRHALRRHERRLQSDQGPLQDGGLSALAPAQRWKPDGRARARTARVIPENIIDAAADRGIAREPEGPGFAAAL